VKAGAHHVAREQRHVAAHAVGDAAQREVGVRHERELGLGAGQRAERGAVAERARLLAAVEVARPAQAAGATGDLEAAEHAVADGDAVDRVAGGHHGADVLVADDEAGLDRDAPVEDVQVAAADAGRLDADDRVAGRLQLGVRALLDAHLAWLLEGHGVHEGATVAAGAPRRAAVGPPP
jgi:hypothetical protein